MATRGRIVKRFCNKAVISELNRDNATRIRSSSCDETCAQTVAHGEDLLAVLNHALAEQTPTSAAFMCADHIDDLVFDTHQGRECIHRSLRYQ